jgi:hypothetical protein
LPIIRKVPSCRKKLPPGVSDGFGRFSGQRMAYIGGRDAAGFEELLLEGEDAQQAVDGGGA